MEKSADPVVFLGRVIAQIQPLLSLGLVCVSTQQVLAQTPGCVVPLSMGSIRERRICRDLQHRSHVTSPISHVLMLLFM